MKMIIAIIGSEDADDLVRIEPEFFFCYKALHYGRFSEKEKHNSYAGC